ncbi:MAG: two pore domain potassium channel family protein, partial [Rhodoferax sp.]|nr:two pore domain potassium channel family protein [Rhodoferax sp.]
MPKLKTINNLRLLLHTRRHPSAILLVVQLLGMLLYPFIESTKAGHIGFNVFGIVVLGITTGMVRRTPGLAWVSAGIAGPVIVLLALQMAYGMRQLLPWSSALEAVFYFYAAGSLIAYMTEDRHASTDELFAAGATFTLLAWGFTHLFVL